MEGLYAQSGKLGCALSNVIVQRQVNGRILLESKCAKGGKNLVEEKRMENLSNVEAKEIKPIEKSKKFEKREKAVEVSEAKHEETKVTERVTEKVTEKVTEEKPVEKVEVRTETKPKTKKGKVVLISKNSVTVKDSSGHGYKVYGIKNVKVGDTIEF